MNTYTCKYEKKIIEEIKNKIGSLYHFDNTLTEDECRSVFKVITENFDVDHVYCSRDWSRIIKNGQYQSYFDTIRFRIYCDGQDDHYFDISVDDNLLTKNNPWARVLLSNSWYTSRLTAIATAFKEVFSLENFLVIPSGNNVIAINKKYIEFRYVNKTKSTFSFTSKTAPSFIPNINVNKKSSGWISSSNNFERRVFMAVNKDNFNDLCDDVDAAIENIIQNNKSVNLAAFSIDFGAKQIKFNSFVGVTGIKEDVRNFDDEIFINIIASFNNNPAVFKYNSNYIDTRYLTTAFKCKKDGSSYKLVPARSDINSWYTFHLSEDNFNDMMAVAENNTENVDDLMAWRLLGELRD